MVTVTLDNPARRNAMSAPMTASWGALMAELRVDRSVRAVVVTGAGDAFCSGGDTGWIGSEPDAGVDYLRERMLPFYRTWLSIRELEVPTIAAVNGPAIGAGMCLALACDLRYAASAAKLGVPFTRLGMHAGMAATWLLPDDRRPRAGPGDAADRPHPGRDGGGRRRAGQPGVRPGRARRRGGRVAASVAACAPIATRLTKVALASGGHADFDAALQWEALAQPITLATADLQEGLAAQRERRRPDFQGR